MSYRRGDWVVYVPDHGSPEIGRVWSVREGACGVCYSRGCTVAVTPTELLRRYDETEFPDLVPDARIGHHRFEETCPDHDPLVCGGCKPGMATRGER